MDGRRGGREGREGGRGSGFYPLLSAIRFLTNEYPARGYGEAGETSGERKKENDRGREEPRVKAFAPRGASRYNET